jgi:hypothetical protein
MSRAIAAKILFLFVTLDELVDALRSPSAVDPSMAISVVVVSE